MAIDWPGWSREAGFTVHAGYIRVDLPDGRTHTVWVEETADPDAIRLWSIAARGSSLPQEEEPCLFAWNRNRTSDIVGYKIDGRGRLIGEAWLPVAGLEAEEWKTYVLVLAGACDRVEYLLTGADSD